MKSLFFYLMLLSFKNDPPNTYILISKPKIIIGCGGNLFAGEFYFINCFDSSSKIGIILCPGDDFIEHRKYQIEFLNDSIVPLNYSLMNVFDTKDLYCPKRVINTIKEIK